MKRRIIINSDDFGITEGVNRAIIELIEAGIMTSTSVMTNMPYYQEIIHYKDRIGIGIHLTLTEGNPVLSPSEIRTLVDENGSFLKYSSVTNRNVYQHFSKDHLFNEFSAQVQRLIDLGIKPSHIDTHESFFKYPFFIPLIRKLAHKFNIKGIRTYSPRKFDLSRLLSPKSTLISIILLLQKRMWLKEGFNVTDRIDSLNKKGLSYYEAAEQLNTIMNGLPDGVLEIVVHPGYCNGDNTPLGDYVKEREAELQALLNDKFKESILNSGAALISYNDI
jgi:chitin disaccharide deacetylase